MRTRHRRWIGTAGIAALAACGGGGGPTGYDSGGQNPPPPPGQQPPPSTSNAILVQNNRFNPSTTTVPVGTTVTWTWDSCTDDPYGGRVCVDHNVTFDGGGPNSATQSAGTFTRQFGAAGTYSYHCTIHSAVMTGQVVVR